MHKLKASLVAALAGAVFLVLAAVNPGQGEAKSLRFIRDAEVENIIRAYATPLFQAAGLNPRAIDVYLVNDPAINAFVLPGLKMFIHTGLLIRAETPLQVIGVIAHETGHLAAGHTATRGESARRSAQGVIASYVLGLAAAVASGRPELGTAIISGGQDIALKGLLSYTRGQESAADQVAVRLLNGTGQSPRGLIEVLRILRGQEVLLSANQDPYMRSHPLTRDRMAFLEEQVRQSPYGAARANPGFQALHARLRAKLIGFLEPRDRVLRSYPADNASLPARYARAIANYREANLDAALALIEALPAYESAVRLLPDSPQLRLGLAQVQIEANDPALARKALRHLSETLRHEPNNSFAWRLTAIAHGRNGNVGLTALALAESALARGHSQEARQQAARAQNILAQDSASWLRASDIEKTAIRRAKRE